MYCAQSPRKIFTIQVDFNVDIPKKCNEHSPENIKLKKFPSMAAATARLSSSQTKMFAKLIDAAYRQIADANYGVNKAVISNADKVGILLNTETGAGFNLPQGSVSVVNGNLNFAGLELYSTSLLAEGNALVGDFNQSQFVIRSAPRLRFFEQNGTDAEKNQILARIEERAALAIFSSLAFVKIEPGT